MIFLIVFTDIASSGYQYVSRELSIYFLFFVSFCKSSEKSQQYSKVVYKMWYFMDGMFLNPFNFMYKVNQKLVYIWNVEQRLRDGAGDIRNARPMGN